MNPGSLILSGAMMLDYLGWKEAAALIRSGMGRLVAEKTVTYDLARQIPGAKALKCSEFARALAAGM